MNRPLPRGIRRLWLLLLILWCPWWVANGQTAQGGRRDGLDTNENKYAQDAEIRAARDAALSPDSGSKLALAAMANSLSPWDQAV